MTRQALAVAVLVALTALPACGRRERSVPQAAPVAPARVAVTTVARRSVPDVLEAVGTVRSHAQTVLSSKIVATVTAVHVREGDRVAAGQTLIELDDRDVAAQLRRARAALEEARSALEESDRAIQAADRALEAARAQDELAQTTLERSRLLIARELIARQEHDEAAAHARIATAEAARAAETRAALVARRSQALARIEQAQADVANATVVAGYAHIAAPSAGIVAARGVEVGNLAVPGAALLTVDEERYRLEATVQESDLPRLRLGQRATAVIDAAGGEVAGTIVEIVPAADPLSRTFTVRIELPPLPHVRSGLYGRARFVLGERPALLVPSGAVRVRGQLEGVFVIDEANLARLRLVQTGKVLAGGVEVLAGLAEGERIVTSPADLADGQAVEPVR